MGGSGGSFLGGDPKDVAKKLRQAEQETQDQAFLSDVEKLLGEVLATANDRDTDAVARHLAVIQQALEKNIDGVVELMFGGSVAKHTYVDGVSDVDALVIVNESELASSDPKSVCDYFIARLLERFEGRVSADGFAINVRFADITVQLVPAIRRGDDYLLPNSECTSWSRVRPNAFTDSLTATNKACNGKVVPTIKLAKVLLTDLPENRRPSGYHLENLAVEAFSGYKGPYTPREMLHHFFVKAPDLIRTPIPDRTSQSRHVDDHLGAKDSTERLMLADAVDRIGRRLRNADGAQDIEIWQRLFGGQG